MTTGLTKRMDQAPMAGEVLSRGGSPSMPPAFRLDLRRALAKHKGLAMMVSLVVFLVVLGYGFTRKPKYEASTVFYISPVQRDPLPQAGTQPGFDSNKYEATIQQLQQTITRMDVVNAAVLSLPEGVWRHRGEPVAAAAARMAAGITVQRVGTSFQLNVFLDGSDAEEVAAGLKALSKAFIQKVREEQTVSANSQIELLQGEQKRLTDTLIQDREELVSLSSAIGVARLGTSQENPLDAAVNNLRQQLLQLQQARTLSLAQLSSGAGSNGGGGGFGDSGSSTTSGLITMLNTRKAQLSGQMAGMTPANPIYQQDQVELQTIEKELAAALDRNSSETKSREDARQRDMMQRAAALEGRLRAELATQTSLAAKAAPQMQQYNELSNEIDRLETRKNALDESIQRLVLEKSGPGQITVAVPPVVPGGPEPGKRNLILFMSLPLALVFGTFAAVLAHRRDRHIYMGRDMEEVLGFKPIAVLPASNEVSQQVQETYYLRLAAAVEHAYRSSGAKTFVFTAPSVATDVEDLVYTLQLKLKDLGYSVLSLGASSLLSTEEEFEELYGRGPSMDAMSRINSERTDGLAAARLEWLKREYDMILIDAPPLTVSGEAEYAIRRADATILVNESGVTTRDELVQAGMLLEKIGLGGIGAVIKDLRMEDADVLFRTTVRAAEEQNAKVVRREPRDNHGAWEVVNAGTDREVIIPGDPMARMPGRPRPKRYTSYRSTVS